MRLIEAGPVEALRRQRTVVVHGQDCAILVVTCGTSFLAIDNNCLGCGAPLGGNLSAPKRVECSRCRWTYDAETGSIEGVPALRTDRYDVIVEDDIAYVVVPAKLAPRH